MNQVDEKIFYNPKFECNAIVVHPGDFYITKDPNLMIITILGSCVAACIRDTQLKIGGLNHFLLPSTNDVKNSSNNRFGAYAMEQLINEILKQGGMRKNLEIKVFGGASLFKSNMDVGQKNIDFIKEYLRVENLTIASEDLGGTHARRIHYWPQSGKIMRLIIQNEHNTIIENEQKYQSKIVKDTTGTVELF